MTEGWKAALQRVARRRTIAPALRAVIRRDLVPLQPDAFRIRAEGPAEGWAQALTVIEVVLFHAAHEADALYRTDTVARLLEAFWHFEESTACHLRVWTLDPVSWRMQPLIDEGLPLAITLLRVRAHQRGREAAEPSAREAALPSA